MDKNKRVLNFRTFFFAAIFAIAAVLTYFLHYLSTMSYIIAIVIESALLLFMLFYYRKCSWKLIGTFIVVFVYIFTIISCAVSAKDSTTYGLINHFGSKSFTLTGRIERIYDDGLSKSILVEPILKEGKADGKVMMYIQENSFGEADLSSVSKYDNVACKVNIDVVDFPSDNNTVNGNFYRLNVKYVCYVKLDNVSVEKSTTIGAIEWLRNRIESIFTNALGDHYGQIAYGMFIGDKSLVDYETKNYYTISGISHILAVSGLHIMFLSWLIMKICQLLHLKKRPSFVIMTCVLLAYNVLADFTPSIVRATIMSLCLNVSALVGERNDMLNNLGFACSLILLFKPFYLFDVGFILSITAVLGIILFAKPIQSGLIEKSPKALRGIIKAFAVSLSAQIGTLPAIIYYFNRLSVYSVIVNILMLYVVMATFIALFCSVLISLILPFMSFMVKIAKIGLIILDFVTKIVASIPGSQIILFAEAAVFTIYVAYFIMSRFVIKQKFKATIIVTCAIYCFATIFAYNIPFTDNRLKLYFINDVKTHSLLLDEKNSAVFIGEYPSQSREMNLLKSLKARNIDEMYMFDMDFNTVKAIIKLFQKTDIGIVYFPECENIEAHDLLDLYGINYRLLGNGEKGKSDVALIDVYGTSCYLYEYKGEKILFANPTAKFYADDPKFADITAVRCRKYENGFPSAKQFCNYSSGAEENENCLALVGDTAYYDIKTDKFEKNV